MLFSWFSLPCLVSGYFYQHVQAVAFHSITQSPFALLTQFFAKKELSTSRAHLTLQPT